MKIENQTLFTAGQFAKLHNINKRTLHYYDEMGLFSPSIKKDNGYRYYSYLQSPDLEILLTLRELHMSIEDIQNFLVHKSKETFIELIDKKECEINDSIKQLKKIKELLIDKKSQLLIPLQEDLSAISVVYCEKENLLLSQPFHGTFDDSDIAILVKHTQELRHHRIFNYHYGSMFCIDDYKNNNEKECFFTKVDHPTKNKNLFIKKEGTYLRAFCIGDWDLLADTYERIFDYAKKHNLNCTGYAFEEGINEMTLNNMDEYITQILVQCE